jgi:hypothetical protein
MVGVRGTNVSRYFDVRQLDIDPAREKNGLNNLEGCRNDEMDCLEGDIRY